MLALNLSNYVALNLYRIGAFSETLRVNSCGRSSAPVGALQATGTLSRSAIRIRTCLPFIRNYGNNETARLYCFKPRKDALAIERCFLLRERPQDYEIDRSLIDPIYVQ